MSPNNPILKSFFDLKFFDSVFSIVVILSADDGFCFVVFDVVVVVENEKDFK